MSKFIINEKLYDTEKAKLIVSYSFAMSSTYLYKTEKGAYFKVVYAPFSKSCVKVLTEKDVKNELIDNCCVDAYEEMFGKLEEA